MSMVLWCCGVLVRRRQPLGSLQGDFLALLAALGFPGSHSRIVFKSEYFLGAERLQP
jgi:hypothetical protein